jgi:hypothetical protein
MAQLGLSASAGGKSCGSGVPRSVHAELGLAKTSVSTSELIGDGAVTADERARMALGVWPRRRRDLLAPFQDGGRFCDLTVEYSETSELPDPAWVDYGRDGNKEALVNKHAGFYRSIFAPSLASRLTRAQDAEARRNFSEQLEGRLKLPLMAAPAPINSLVETLVFAKPSSA